MEHLLHGYTLCPKTTYILTLKTRPIEGGTHITRSCLGVHVEIFRGRATTHGVGDGGGIHLKNVNFQWFAVSANSRRFGIANGSLIFFWAILTVKQTGLLCASASHRVSWRHDPDFLWSWPAVWLKGHEYYAQEGYTSIILYIVP